jgi:hypothetical protein
MQWQSHRLMVMGFQHMHFVVWDEPRRARLWRVDCGGGPLLPAPHVKYCLVRAEEAGSSARPPDARCRRCCNMLHADAC